MGSLSVIAISPKHAQLASSAPRSSYLHDPVATMYSSLNRAQAVFGFFTTVACVVAALAALSTLLFPTAATTTSVDLKNVQV